MPDLSVFDELEAMSKDTAYAFDEAGNKLPPASEPKEEEKKDAKVQKPASAKDEEEKEENEEVAEEEELEDETEEEQEDSTDKEESSQDEELRDKLMSLLANLQEQPPAETKKEPAPKDEAPKPKTFVTDEDLNDLTAERLNEKLNNVYQQAQQDVLRSVSQTVGKVVSDAIDLRMTVSEFYRDNKDLVKYKPAVSLVVTSIQKQHPDWNIGQIVQELGKEVRTILGLTAPDKTKNKKPTFAKPPSGSRKVITTPQKKITGMQAELRELLERKR